MSKIPSLNYEKVMKALQGDGWVIVRQRRSHIRLQKHVGNETFKIIVPAHKPIKRSTLSHILKQARMTVDDFLEKLCSALHWMEIPLRSIRTTELGR